MDKPPQLSPVEAYEAIQRLLAEGDSLGLTKHARLQCAERRVTIDDIRKVLVHGNVSPTAEWDDKYCNWKYLVAGLDCEGDPLTVVLALEPRFCRMSIITVIGK